MTFIGKKIGHYKVQSAIGAGGMGEVYLAEDTQLERRVALKILPADVVSNQERMRRFVLEAKSASALNHPNILTIYEIGESDGTYFIATEFIDGKTLSDSVKANSLDYKSALEIAIQVASALDEAHSAGIVHRDIKPENVMIRANGLVKILDFGIAKLSGANNQPNTDAEAGTAIKSGTTPGTIIGTANYMSPEQAKGKEVDARTDIFSFGVVLYEIIAGYLPFEGETMLEMLGSILRDEPKPLSNSDTPEIERIIGKCLRKDRDERYQTIKDALIDLKDLKQELEFQNKLEKTISSDKEEPKTQILQARISDEIQQTTPTETVDGKPSSGKSYLTIGLAIILISAVGILGYRYYESTLPINSIAVLPFANSNSSNTDTEYLSDGLAESLIYRFSQLPNLKVSPTSSVFRYKGKETDAVKVGNELEVNAIITGRIIQRGDNLTISVELIDVRNNKLLWGKQYERKISELLTTQSEITSDITQNLELKLSSEGEQVLTKRYTDNNEAYQLYLKGRFCWNKRSGDDLKKGIEYFRQAVEVDPNFALAWSGLADSYALLPLFSVTSTEEVRAKIRTAVTKALELDPKLAEAHNSQAVFLAIYEWDFVEADKEFRRAIELNPNYATAYQWFSITLSWRLRHDEAIKEMQQALEIEPLSRIINNDFGYTFLYQKQPDKAIEQFKKTLELYPDFAHGYHSLALALAKAGKYEEAIIEQNEAIALAGRLPGFVTQLSYINAVSGNKVEAKKLLEELLERKKNEPVGDYNLSIVYAGLGDKNKAFELLAKPEQERFARMLAVKSSPYFESLHDDPRFQELLKRLNLPE